MSSIDEMSHGLGRLEGKLDLVLEKMRAVETRAASLAEAETVAHLEARVRLLADGAAVERLEGRVQRLELTAAKVGGLSAGVSASVGILVSALAHLFK